MKYIITFSDSYVMAHVSTVTPFIAARLLMAAGIEASDTDAVLEAAMTTTQFVKTPDGYTMTVMWKREK